MRDLARIGQRFQSIQIVEYKEDLRAQLEALAIEMHAQSLFKNLDLDISKTMLMVSCANDTDGSYFRVAHRSGVVLGAVYGFKSATFFGHDLISQVKGIWVSQGHKGSAAFILLLKSFEDWAKAQGARLVFLDQTTALDIERSLSLFEGCGYRLIGINTVKEL